jgi:hypothetical protein
MVRLSGSAVYLLKLEKHDYEEIRPDHFSDALSPRRNTFHYSYPAIQDAGWYYLEVLIVFCASLDPSDFVGNCVEDYMNGANIVNAPYSVYLNASVGTEVRHVPRWKLFDHNGLAPLATRIQKRCNESMPTCEYKKDPSELIPFQVYNWTDGPDWNRSYAALHLNHTRLCIVGASHARELSKHAKQIITDNSSISVEYILSFYPHMFSMPKIEQRKCDNVVVTYGQWPVAFTNPVVCNATCYRDSMRAVLTEIVQHAGPTKFYLMSTNYNALSSRIITCPPTDHRSPPVVDLLNRIAAELAAELRVHYIDLNHIMGPMWDSAYDYCHPVGKVFTAQAEWVLNYIFTFNRARA